ncbi:DUF4157 domain-containing protein [Chitinophaga horti]|uniref:DUF4157 domain-containing protein n=1 Tax=Chitinophaga horti TaxID=2920382 RepID=A0ABY6J0N9_9BACT|nr:DUF4157 domain-containing protein [Chitinophaga horti]UYQ93216.1 DUF4157 domain-containing protein [Chitinophaga horti]
MSIIICTIKENSWVARLAARKMKSPAVAIVFGHKIHLYGADRQRFLRDVAWVRHEVCHVRQYRRHGFFGFLVRYLADWIRNGYFLNKFEVEARQAEHSPVVMQDVRIV